MRSTSGRGRVDDGNSKDGRWTAAASASTADGEDDEEEVEVIRTGDCSLNGDEGFDSLGGRGGGFDTVGLGFSDELADPMVGDGSCDGLR